MRNGYSDALSLPVLLRAARMPLELCITCAARTRAQGKVRKAKDLSSDFSTVEKASAVVKLQAFQKVRAPVRARARHVCVHRRLLCCSSTTQPRLWPPPLHCATPSWTRV